MTAIPLNPEQQAVVDHISGPMLVDAVAGSGKSTALIERVVNLVNGHRISPARILLLTFSRDARDQTDQRLNKRMPYAGQGIAKTFHSLALDIYKAEMTAAPYIDQNGALYRKAIYQAYKRLKLEPAPKPLLALASRAKNDVLDIRAAMRKSNKIDPELFKVATTIARDAELTAEELIQTLYIVEDIRERDGVEHNGGRVQFVTFDDMLYEAIALLHKPAVQKRWSARWQYVMQDEAQDSNAAQIQIANALCRDHKNYVVVGDASQAVYGFRGARPEKMLSFDKDWPGARVITMFRNYRSGLEIIDFANRIRGKMPKDTVLVDKHGAVTAMTSERKTHAHVGFHVFNDDDDEARAIAQNCNAHARDGIPYSDQAILVRMNFMTRAIEMSLAAERVPYTLVSGASFFDAKETKLMFGYLRVATKRASSDDVTSAMLFPSRGISKVTCDAVSDRGSVDGDWIPSAQAEAPNQNRMQQDKLRQWCGMIDVIRRQISRDYSPSQILAFVRESTGFDAWAKRNVDQDDDSASAQTLEEVFGYCKRYATVAELLDAVDAIDRHRNAYQRQKNCVTVVTVHKVKGQEYPIIYLPQMAHGRFPSKRGDVSEERRLFYVATTRAMNELWISRPASANRAIIREASGEAEKLMTNDRGLFEDDGHIDSIFLTELGVQSIPTFKPGKIIDAVPVGSQLSLV